MLGKLASDALGLSDVGSIVKPENFNQTASDDFTLHEDGEKIFFLIKSKSDEYCFTNLAFIHLDGNSATSKKRNLKRYDYYLNKIKDVSIETAGTIDLDLELKFTIGNTPISIDIHKKHENEIADIYKALLAISKIQADNERQSEHAMKALTTAQSVVQNPRITIDGDLPANFKEITNFTYEWLNQIHEKYMKKDFGDVFQKYIQN